jgi:DNA-binding CsgD family transcriptional regulator
MPRIDLPNGDHLTPQEVQTIRLLLEWMTVQQAADALGPVRRTVYWHIAGVHRKLRTQNAMQAGQRLQELGLLEIVMRET